MCVFYAVVLHAGLNEQSLLTQINETIRNEENLSNVEHRHDNPVANLEYARVNKSIIYVTRHERNASINKLSLSKTTSTQQVESFTQPREISDYFSHIYEKTLEQ